LVEEGGLLYGKGNNNKKLKIKKVAHLRIESSGTIRATQGKKGKRKSAIQIKVTLVIRIFQTSLWVGEWWRSDS
jgi:hypothetical protein